MTGGIRYESNRYKQTFAFFGEKHRSTENMWQSYYRRSWEKSFKNIGNEFGIKLDTELISGNPAEEIVKYAKEDDLLILGDHGKKKGMERFMLGSVSNDIIRNAPCAVLVVKPK